MSHRHTPHGTKDAVGSSNCPLRKQRAPADSNTLQAGRSLFWHDTALRPSILVYFQPGVWESRPCQLQNHSASVRGSLHGARFHQTVLRCRSANITDVIQFAAYKHSEDTQRPAPHIYVEIILHWAANGVRRCYAMGLTSTSTSSAANLS